jgi:hypothetical protein
MQFTRIWFDGSTVALGWSDKPAGATEKHEFEHTERPTGAFRDALSAFGPFVSTLLSLPDHWRDELVVRSLSLKVEAKTGARGLQVTVMRKIAEAKNRPVTITTPYLSAPPADYEGDGVGYLDDVTLALIDEAETQAEAYRGGDYGEQTSLPLGETAPSENAKTFDERAAAAEVASTRKPGKQRGKKKSPAFIPGVGDVHNPTATEVVTDDVLRESLLAVGRDVPIDAIARWGSIERERAWRWTRGEFAEEPLCVRESAAPLLSDGWTDPVPPRVDTEGAREIMDAAIRS